MNSKSGLFYLKCCVRKHKFVSVLCFLFLKNNEQQAKASEVAFTLDLAFIPDRGRNPNRSWIKNLRNQSTEMLRVKSDDWPVWGLCRTDKSRHRLSDYSNILCSRKNIRLPKSFGFRIELFFEVPESGKMVQSSCQGISSKWKRNR